MHTKHTHHHTASCELTTEHLRPLPRGADGDAFREDARGELLAAAREAALVLGTARLGVAKPLGLRAHLPHTSSRSWRRTGPTQKAASAEEALELLGNPACHVDVFVTDVVMPGMDGPGWVQQALVHRPEVRVVFMSGYAEETFGDIQARIANSVFLPKPFSLKQLAIAVKEMLEGEE
mgnify:CR=1 FL=1